MRAKTRRRKDGWFIRERDSVRPASRVSFKTGGTNKTVDELASEGGTVVNVARRCLLEEDVGVDGGIAYVVARSATG